MEEYFGLRPTGRQFRDPAATLVELEDDQGLKHTAVVYEEAYRGRPGITLDVELVLSFLQYPMVVGLVELSHHDLERGTFVYPTGPVWTLKELLRHYSDLSKTLGLRAGLELAWLASQVLTEASETGPQQGCFSHGNLNPWRVALRPDGQVQVFGYGLPQIELSIHREDPSFPVDADSVRYAPPERLQGQPEDISSDTYCLTLLAYEMITGKPLYAGNDVADIERAVGMAEGAAILSRPNDLPRPVAQVLARSLIFDPDARLTGRQYSEELAHLLQGKVNGPSLSEIVETVVGSRKQGPRRSARLVSTETSAFTPDQLAALADGDDDDVDLQEDADEQRWSKPDEGASRRRRRKSEPEPEPEPESRRRRRRPEEEVVAEEAPGPRRRRRRTEPAEPEEEPVQAAPRRRKRAADPDPEPEPEESPRRRRRRAEPEPAPEPEPEPQFELELEEDEPEVEAKDEPEAAAPKASARRRLRRSGSEPATSSRRRRRKSAEDDKEG